MQVCYIDESGDAGKFVPEVANSQPLFVLSGIVVDQQMLPEMTCSVIELKRKFTVEEKFGRPAKMPVYHYNLDLVIALGYRIDSPVAIKFRQWATTRLHEYIQKGFALDDARLKQGGRGQ